MAVDVPPPIATADVPVARPRPRRRGRLAIVGLLVVGLVAAGVAWSPPDLALSDDPGQRVLLDTLRG